MSFVAKTLGPLAVAAVVSCLLPDASRAADAADGVKAAVDQAFRPLLEKYDIPGMAVAVTANGQQYFFSYGVASKESKAPVTKDTLFELGSVSKTFTATLIAHARARGLLSLDDHPGQYVPALRESAIDKATVLQLATYTAGGLPLQFPDDIENDSAMPSYFRQFKPSAAPGEQRRYSNPSIGLAGHVAAVAMKGNFASLVEREIFPPLGLHHSYIHVPKAAMAAYAWGYNKANRPVRVNPGALDGEAYGVKSTAADMIRFVEANIRPDDLADPMRRAVEGTHIGYLASGEIVQGLGWEQYAYPVTLERLLAGNSEKMSMRNNAATWLEPPRVPSEPTLFNKTGSTGGFGTYVAFVPAKKIGIVMLANRNFPNAARITAAHAVLTKLSGAP